MEDFINNNKKFWSDYKYINSDNKILIEEPSISMIIHPNAIFALIINQAKGYNPVWIKNKSFHNIELLKSYNPNTEIATTPKISLPIKTYTILVSLAKFIKVLVTKNILGITYDKVKYGDIIYDTFLIQNSVATIKKINFKLTKIIAQCIVRHIEIKNTLKSGNYKGVLTSHQVGIRSGVMLRVALRYGYEGYLRAGHHQSTLQCFKKPDDVYDYEYKPFPADIDNILKFNNNLEKEFLEIMNLQISGKGDKDGLEAFSKDNLLYTNRNIFNQEYKIDSSKKNIFIMLHAFNDYPHSHFRWMIFKDYYDWFFQTLEFAKKYDKVNWIFKQHPSIRHYPTKDVNIEKLFLNCPKNIYYINENKQIDTRSLIHCADLVVTCLGSAGFELPAMGAIPSLTAGDNFYTDLGFALEPKNKKEYFDFLNQSDKITKISKEKQDRAKAAYIYIYKKSRVEVSACPRLSADNEKDKKIDSWYWDKVIDQYIEEKSNIIIQTNRYISEVKKADFRHL